MNVVQTQPADAPTRSTMQRVAIILAVFLQIGSTFLPSLGIGEQIGSRSDDVRTMITPVGWAFSIWGLLYLGSILFAVYQALPAQKSNHLLRSIGWFAAAAFAGNGIWALYTQSNALTFISVIIIATSLFCLLAIYRRFVAWEPGFTAGERWLAVLPLSALAAWLSAATIVNIAAALKYYGWAPEGGAPTLAAGIVLVGGVIASLAIWRGRGNPFYSIVFLWALFGIYSAGGQSAPAIAYAAIGSAVLVIVSCVTKLSETANRKHWFG